MKRAIILAGLVFAFTLFLPATSGALSLKLQPLIYNATLSEGEIKKGFVDISNPTSQTLKLKTSVQAFRQINNDGGLEFYDDERISGAIIPDLAEFELGSKEAIRMFFLIDSSKLPKGDVFAALFVSTQSDASSGAALESVQLGTIITLVNGEPGPRTASIESLSAQPFQLGSEITGSYVIKNLADEQTTTGFYPEVALRLTPLGGQTTNQSPLVMAGNTRQAKFVLPGNHFGIYKLSASYEKSEQSRWLFVITGFWQWLAPLILAGIVMALVLLKKRGKKSLSFKEH